MISSQRNLSGSLQPSAHASNTNTNQNSNINNKNTHNPQNASQSNTSHPNISTNAQLQLQTQTNSNRNSLMVPSIDASGMLAAPSRYGVDGSDAMSIHSARGSVRSARTIRSMSKYPKDDRTRVPHPSHRHASPSAPWPWVDLGDEVDPLQLESGLPPIPPLCSHRLLECNNCWKGYPQSRFPNWTRRQVIKSKIWNAVRDYNKEKDCVLHRVDVDSDGLFLNPGKITAGHGPDKEAEIWKTLVEDKRPEGLRVRALFLENISGPVLQMLGAKYNIEPFFWSSSLNWIPSRFQEEVKPGIGDHITITLTFLRSMSNHQAIQMSAALATTSTDSLPMKGGGGGTGGKPSTMLGSQKIDPHSPLVLHSNDRLLVLDLLAVHLIRNVNGSTIISFHPTLNLPTTTAAFLQERIRFAGQSVYWQSIFQKSADPTFLLLAFMWHALYAWDEALENLYDHICSLETRVIETSNMRLTQELHLIRAHHLHYSSLLDDYTKHIEFIKNTPNPALDNLPQKDRDFSKRIMEREAANLSTEIKRLGTELYMQERRLKNVIGLVFSSVNITDSKYMREMTEAAVRDSAAMKQVAYLTMVFLPASFVAGVFGMNVSEINPGSNGTLPRYVEIALPLTLVTAWIIIAFQSKYIFENQNTTFMQRLGWPAYLIMKMIQERKKEKEEERERMEGNKKGDNFDVDDADLGNGEVTDGDEAEYNLEDYTNSVSHGRRSSVGTPGSTTLYNEKKR